jgi:WD40 repeat protein
MTSYCCSAVHNRSALHFFDIATNKPLQADNAFPAGVHVNCFEYLPNGFGMFCGCSDGKVRLFDARSNKVVSEEKICNDQVSGIKLVVAEKSDKSATLFTCSTDGIAREFDFRNLSNISFFFNSILVFLIAGCL